MLSHSSLLGVISTNPTLVCTLETVALCSRNSDCVPVLLLCAFVTVDSEVDLGALLVCMMSVSLLVLLIS